MDSPELSSMPYEPPESLWQLVEGSVSQEESEEIRKILGDSLVDQSLDLHAEVYTLLDIWQSFRCETDTLHATISPKPLPEPPGMRDSLRNHIKMLVDNIREKAAVAGGNSDALLLQHKSDIIGYALEGSSRGSSPGCMRSRPSSSVSSRSGRETPMRMTPSSEGDGLSGSTTASERVDSFRDKLNVHKIDEVVQELRSQLRDEVSQLLVDIRFLQDSLEEETDFRCESQMTSYSEPSLQELKEERSRLERTSSSFSDTISAMSTVPTGMRKAAPGSPKHILKPLSPISSRAAKQCLRPSPPSSASTGQVSRPSPLKARHVNVTSADSKYSLDKNNHAVMNGRTCNNNNVIVSEGSVDAKSPARVISPSSQTMRPSPPSSAKRGSPSSNRFRQRFRAASKQNST